MGNIKITLVAPTYDHMTCTNILYIGDVGVLENYRLFLLCRYSYRPDSPYIYCEGIASEKRRLKISRLILQSESLNQGLIGAEQGSPHTVYIDSPFSPDGNFSGVLFMPVASRNLAGASEFQVHYSQALPVVSLDRLNYIGAG